MCSARPERTHGRNSRAATAREIAAARSRTAATVIRSSRRYWPGLCAAGDSTGTIANSSGWSRTSRRVMSGRTRVHQVEPALRVADAMPLDHLEAPRECRLEAFLRVVGED